MNRNGIGNIRNDAARRQLEVAAGVRRDMGFAADVRREELNKQAEELGQSMMAQAETLPSGILASSPELQQTAMAMANGGPVQRFANGNQVRTGRKLTLSDLYRTPLATSEDESIYGGDPAELPTLRAAAMREGVGSFFGNIPRQAAEFIASKPRFRPKQFADLFGVSSARAQDMGSPTDLNVSDTIVNEASTPSVSLTDTGIERPKEPEDFLPPDITNPIVNVDELSFTQSLFSPAAAKARAARNKADRERRRKSTLAQNLAGITNPGFGMIPQDPTKVTDEIVTDPAEEDTTSLVGLRAISDEQEEFDAQQEQSDLDQGSTLKERAARLVSGNQLDAALDKRESDKTKSSQLRELTKNKKITSKQAQDVANRNRKTSGSMVLDDDNSKKELVVADSDSEKNTKPRDALNKILKDLNTLPDKDTGNIILDAVGEKKEEKLENRIKKYKKIANDLFGEDIEGEKTERAYNLAFLGFAIAAGDSPNALSNISKGLLSATKKFNDSAERKKKRKQKINELALSEALKDTRDEKDYFRKRQIQKERFSQRLNELGITESGRNKRLVAEIVAGVDKIDAQINANISVANRKITSVEKRARLERENNLLIAEKRNLPKAFVAFDRYARKTGLELTDENYGSKFNEFKKQFGSLLSDTDKKGPSQTAIFQNRNDDRARRRAKRSIIDRRVGAAKTQKAKEAARKQTISPETLNAEIDRLSGLTKGGELQFGSSSSSNPIVSFKVKPDANS